MYTWKLSQSKVLSFSKSCFNNATARSRRRQSAIGWHLQTNERRRTSRMTLHKLWWRIFHKKIFVKIKPEPPASFWRYFRLFNTAFNTVDSKYNLPMTGFERQISYVRSDRFTNWATAEVIFRRNRFPEWFIRPANANAYKTFNRDLWIMPKSVESEIGKYLATVVG